MKKTKQSIPIEWTEPTINRKELVLTQIVIAIMLSYLNYQIFNTKTLKEILAFWLITTLMLILTNFLIATFSKEYRKAYRKALTGEDDLNGR